jgi:hypothetical protein
VTLDADSGLSGETGPELRGAEGSRTPKGVRPLAKTGGYPIVGASHQRHGIRPYVSCRFDRR